jgi:hypothetical protein
MAILWYSGMKLQRDKIIRGRISEHGNLIAWRHTDRDSCFGCQENRKDAVHVGCAMSCMHGMEVPPWRKCMCISPLCYMFRASSHRSLQVVSPRTREKVDTIEPTLLRSSLVYLVLLPCSLQTCSVFPFYEVVSQTTV